MPDLAPTDYITKTEAARFYRRSERSISRDITNAVKFGDQRLLKFIELRLEDGTRRPGTELTIDEVVELRDRGLNPTWMLQIGWLTSSYGRRDEPLDIGGDLDPPIQPEMPEASTALAPEQHVAVLTAQNDALRQANADLRIQADRLEKELDRRAEERREENELQKQNNVLMQQIYNLLSPMQDSSGLLTAPRPSQKPSGHQATVEAKTSIQQEGTDAARANTRRVKDAQRQTPAKASQTRTQKQPGSTKSKSAPPTKGVLQRWFPTFTRSNRTSKN